MLSAFCERARAGVAIRLLADAMGSILTPDCYFDDLPTAGEQMFWYHPLRRYSWQEVNNRTHRKLLVSTARLPTSAVPESLTIGFLAWPVFPSSAVSLSNFTSDSS